MAGFPAVLAFLLIYIFPMGMTMVSLSKKVAQSGLF